MGPPIDLWTRCSWQKGLRYYEVLLHQDLWGDWVLTRIWGRRGTQLGRTVHTPCASYRDACDQLVTVKARRKRRGYMASLGGDPSR
jgi:predicted DNA-binding WGR domain protein